MQRIRLVFPESQMERLGRRARIEDRPISDLIRRAAEDFLSRPPENPLPDMTSINADLLISATNLSCPEHRRARALLEMAVRNPRTWTMGMRRGGRTAPVTGSAGARLPACWPSRGSTPVGHSTWFSP